MTLHIVWRPSKETDNRLDVPAVSSFIDVMRVAGYHIPCTLDTDDRPVLVGMAAVFGRNVDTPNPYAQLVDLIDRHDSIDLNTAA
jgi:hypothetical protein